MQCNYPYCWKLWGGCHIGCNMTVLRGGYIKTSTQSYQRGVKRFTKVVRAMALVRAQHRCERCGTAEKLTLHHILGRVSNHLNNAQVLCEECHYWKHHVEKRHHK
jgi:hypothetical protein